MNSQRRAFLAVIDDRSTYYCQRKASVINPRRVAFRAAKKKGHAEITQDAPESHSRGQTLPLLRRFLVPFRRFGRLFLLFRHSRRGLRALLFRCCMLRFRRRSRSVLRL